MSRPSVPWVMGVLAAIALSATVVALALQVQFGRLPFLTWIGTAIAAVGGAVFAQWLSHTDMRGDL